MRLASGLPRLFHAVLAVAFTLLMLAAAVAAGLAWRLSEGPLDLAWAARRVENAVNQPDAPVRLAIGGAALAWAGFKGAEHGLEFALRDVRLLTQAGEPVARAATLDFTLSPIRLLFGQIAPETVAASGLELHLARMPDGGIGLGSDGAAQSQGTASGRSLAETVAGFSRPARPGGASDVTGRLSQLRQVRLDDSGVELQDRVLGGSWRLGVQRLDLRRQPRGGVQGSGQVTVAFGSAPPAALSLRAALVPDGGTQITATLAPLEVAPLVALLQQAGSLGSSNGLDAKLAASASVRLSPGLLPMSATAEVTAGPGRLVVSGATIAADSLAVEAEATWDGQGWSHPASLAVKQAKAVLRPPRDAPPTTVLASGRLARQGGAVAGTADISLDQVAFSDVGDFWPQPLGGHVRPWVTQNLTAGTARDGAVKLGFTAAPDFKAFKITAINGSLTGTDTTIWWLRPVPPVEHAAAKLSISDPDSLDIAVSAARQGAMELRNGQVRIIGLSKKDQFMSLGTDESGSVAELLALLKNPRMKLLSRKPLPMRNPSGSFAGHLGVAMPLNENLQFEDVKIKARAHLAGLNLGGLVAGRDLRHGDLDLQATSDALDVKGTATIGGIDSTISVGMDFRDGPPDQVVQQASAVGRATAGQLAATGFDPGSLFQSGSSLLSASYVQRRNGTATLQIKGNLADAGLALAGWHKPPGPPAEVQARLLLRDEQLVGIEALQAHGPSLDVEGRAETAGGGVRVLALDRVEVGPTKGRGTVRFPGVPGQPIHAAFSGPVLDLSTTLAKSPNQPPPPNGPSGPDTPWVADLRFGRVLLSGEGGVSDVVAHAESNGRRLSKLHLVSGGTEHVQATLQPEGAGRHLVVKAADGGGLLRDFGILDTVDGGQLTVDARYDDTKPESPLAGAAKLEKFHVRNAQVIGKLLQAATIYGVGDALSGPGVAFDELKLPFRLNGAVLDINGARASSASLGLTAQGEVNTAKQSLDLHGTIVPAYALNSLLGRIPVVGRLFRAERGGGLIAMNFAVRGAFADPSITANPLSALTPGALRRLFHFAE